jgi:hypothetical protein
MEGLPSCAVEVNWSSVVSYARSLYFFWVYWTMKTYNVWLNLYFFYFCLQQYDTTKNIKNVTGFYFYFWVFS